MRKKLFLVLSLIFISLLTNCSVSENSEYINMKEPEIGDILVQGEDFMIVADVGFTEGIRDINAEIFTANDANMWISLCDSLIPVEEYDSVLWRCDLLNEDVNFSGKFLIEKKLSVPPDVPEGEYCLKLNSRVSGGNPRYSQTVLVCVVSPERYNSIKELD